MMKAVVIERYGGNEVVDLREISKPAPGPEEVLIKVKAASVNPVDWKIRDGALKLFTGWRFPRVLGCECAGEVAETGSAVRRFRKGDRVVGFTGIRRQGAFAEYAITDERNTFLMPGNLTFGQAAALPIAGLTALQALRDLGGIWQGCKVLINGASGGVGTFAVQIAGIFRGEVTAVCGGTNVPLVKELGADWVIDYTREDFTNGSERYDLIFDAVAKRSFSECKGALASGGAYISTLPTPSVLFNQYVTGYFAGKKAKLVTVRPNSADMDWMRVRIERGRLRIVVDRSFTLEAIREAFAFSESARARGKILLQIE